MILLEYTNKYDMVNKEGTIGFTTKRLPMFSIMYNIGDDGEYISNIEILSDIDNGRVLIQMNIETYTNSNSFILVEDEIACTTSVDKYNLYAIESFKKLEKYREELLKVINMVIHETKYSGVYRTAIITIGEPDFDAGEYNIMLRYSN